VFKWLEILGCEEHTGVGMHPEETVVQETDQEGNKYSRGTELEISEAVIMKITLLFRDFVNQLIEENVGAADDFRVLDLGSGRGGATRFLAGAFKKARKLRQMVAANISPKENELNRKMAEKEGLSSRLYRVDQVDFDDLSGYQDESFDVILSIDSFYYSANKRRLVPELTRILAQDGVIIFSDILANATASRDQ